MKNKKQALAILKGNNWAVAELKVSYKFKNRTNVKICSSSDAYSVFFQMWDKELINIQEQFNVLFLNRGNEVIGFRNISIGTISANLVDVNLIFALALNCRASAIIIAHNHPSGTLRPSDKDISITGKINKIGKLLGIEVLDHMIITPNGYLSFVDEGLTGIAPNDIEIIEKSDNQKLNVDKELIRIKDIHINTLETHIELLSVKVERYERELKLFPIDNKGKTTLINNHLKIV